MKKKFLSFLLIGSLASAMLTGCGSSTYKSEAAYDYDYAASESAMASNGAYLIDSAENASGSDGFSITDDALPMDTSRKLIVTVNLETETKTYDDAMSTITDKVSSLNGYIQDMNTSNYSYNTARSCNMTIRVPAKNLKEFLGVVENTLNITSYKRSAEDVTLDYVDTESRISALKVEQERLEAFLAKAQTIEEVMQIEQRMTEVRYQLENYESIKRTYDNKIDYSTVYLNVREVVIYSEPVKDSVGSRIKQGFKDNFGDAAESVSNTFVNLIIAIPGLFAFLFNTILILFFPALIVLFILWCIGIIGSKKHKEAKLLKKEARDARKAEKIAKEKAESEARLAAARAKADAAAKAKAEAAAKANAEAAAKVNNTSDTKK